MAAIDNIRRAKTAVVRNAVPKVYQDLMAGSQLYGRALDAQARGHTAVADKMKAKAGAWAQGNREIPGKVGNWTGNNSVRKGLDYTASASRQATGAAIGAGKVAAAAPALAGSVFGDVLSALPKAAPVLGKLAVPLTALAAGVAAGVEGKKGYDKGGVTGAAVDGIHGALDSVTLGLATWAYHKAGDALLPAKGQRTPVNVPRSSVNTGGHGNPIAPAQQAQFNAADRHYRDSHMTSHSPEQPVPGDDSHKGWTPQARIEAAKARGAKTLPYGGDPTQAPGYQEAKASQDAASPSKNSLDRPAAPTTPPSSGPWRGRGGPNFQLIPPREPVPPPAPGNKIADRRKS